MHGGITANVLIISLIYLSLCLEEDVNDRFFLLINSKMQWCLAVDVCAVHIDFVVIEKCDHVVDVTMNDCMKQDVRSNFLHLPYHT